MKKLVLGVVALGVMVNVMWAYKVDLCASERQNYANCLDFLSRTSYNVCKDSASNVVTLEKQECG